MTFSARHFSALAGVLLIGATACSKSEEKTVSANRITFNDFESLDGWGPANASLTTVQAYSGRYSIKVDQDAEYSLNYRNLLGKASVAKIQKLTLHGWVFPAGPKSTGSLVVQIVDPNNGKQIYYESLDLGKEVKEANKWNEVRKEFTLPANIEAAQELRVYMWRGGSEQPTYLDDLEILKGE